MALRDAVFDATSQIQNEWPHLDEVRQILKTADQTEGGYIARKERAHLIGYLVVDQREGQPSGEVATLPGIGLNHRQRELLWGVQEAIDSLVEELTESLPAVGSATPASLDPYSEYDYSVPDSVESVSLTDEETVEIICDGLGKSRPAEVLRQVPVEVTSGQSDEKIRSGVLRVRRTVDAAGVEESAEEIRGWMQVQPPDRPDRLWVKTLVGLACARMIIETVIQLVYQALRWDTFHTFDQDNVFSIPYRGRTSTGTGIIIRSIPTGRILHPQEKIVYVDLPQRQMPLDGAYWTHSVGVRFSADSGDERRLALRVLDEDLNPYGNICGGFID